MKLETYKKYIEKLRELERDYQNSADLDTQNKIKPVKLEIDKHLTEKVERKILFISKVIMR